MVNASNAASRVSVYIFFVMYIYAASIKNPGLCHEDRIFFVLFQFPETFF